MPTTLLHGETWDQAYKRRFREEAEIDARIAAAHAPDKSIRYTIDLGMAGEWLCDVFYKADPCFATNDSAHFEVVAILRNGERFPVEIEEQLISELTWHEMKFQASCAAGFEIMNHEIGDYNVCLGN